MARPSHGERQRLTDGRAEVKERVAIEVRGAPRSEWTRRTPAIAPGRAGPDRTCTSDRWKPGADQFAFHNISYANERSDRVASRPSASPGVREFRSSVRRNALGPTCCVTSGRFRSGPFRARSSRPRPGGSGAASRPGRVPRPRLLARGRRRLAVRPARPMRRSPAEPSAAAPRHAIRRGTEHAGAAGGDKPGVGARNDPCSLDRRPRPGAPATRPPVPGSGRRTGIAGTARIRVGPEPSRLLGTPRARGLDPRSRGRPLRTARPARPGRALPGPACRERFRLGQASPARRAAEFGAAGMQARRQAGMRAVETLSSAGVPVGARTSPPARSVPPRCAGEPASVGGMPRARPGPSQPPARPLAGMRRTPHGGSDLSANRVQAGPRDGVQAGPHVGGPAPRGLRRAIPSPPHAPDALRRPARCRPPRRPRSGVGPCRTTRARLFRMSAAATGWAGSTAGPGRVRGRNSPVRVLPDIGPGDGAVAPAPSPSP